MADTFSLDSTPAELADVAGFRTGAAATGLKDEGPDVGVIFCEGDCAGTALFAENAARAAPVQVSRPRALAGRLRAVVANSGNANLFTGEQGMADACEMISLAASGLDVPEEQVIAASVGAAGVPLPTEQLSQAVEAACSDALEGGRGDFASVIIPAGASRRVASASGVVDGRPFRVAGVTRGISLADTGMANVFAFIATDVAVEPEFLGETARSVLEDTFGRLVVDAGVGTNDTLCILCSGSAGNEPLDNLLSAGVFIEALSAVARRLAIDLAFDEQGPTRLVDVQVSGAASDEDAEKVARAVAGSTLVRTAVHAGMPSWERVLAAAGRSGAHVVDSRATVRIAGAVVYDRGEPAEDPGAGLPASLRSPCTSVELDLGLGMCSAEMWTCSLSDGDDSALRKLQEEFDDVVAARGDLRAELDGARASGASAEETAAGMREQLERRDGELAAARAELAEKTETLKDIEWENAKDIRDVRRELQAELDRRDEEIAALRGGPDGGGAGDGATDSAKKKDRADALEAELEDVRTRLALKTQLVEQLKAEQGADREAAPPGGGDALQARVEELEAELEKAKASAAPAGGEPAALREELAQARSALDEKDALVKEMEWEHARELREARKAAAEEAGPAGDRELLERINELEAELEDAKAAGGGAGDGELERLRAALGEKDALIQKMKADRAKELAEARKAAGAPASAGDAPGDLEARVKSLEARLAKADEKLRKRAEKIAELREKIGGA